MDFSKVTLSVLIPTLNRVGHLKACLESIAQQSVPATEIVLVDQSDDDQTKNLFEEIPLGEIKKKYVHQKEKSLIIARNRALDESSNSEFACFLDDDLVLYPDFFEKLLIHFLNDKEKKFAGGMGTFAGQKKHENYLAKFFMMSHPGEGNFLPNGLPTHPHWKKEFSEIEFLSGGITMFRADILKKYRYDDRLIGYGHGDDIDVSYRISRRYKMFIEPKAQCKHDYESPGRDPGMKHRTQYVQNIFYLLKKNVGLSPKSVLSYGLFVTGSILEDLRHQRKGALLGNFIALKNVITGNIDSVRGYKKQRS